MVGSGTHDELLAKVDEQEPEPASEEYDPRAALVKTSTSALPVAVARKRGAKVGFWDTAIPVQRSLNLVSATASPDGGGLSRQMSMPVARTPRAKKEEGTSYKKLWDAASGEKNDESMSLAKLDEKIQKLQVQVRQIDARGTCHRAPVGMPTLGV